MGIRKPRRGWRSGYPSPSSMNPRNAKMRAGRAKPPIHRRCRFPMACKPPTTSPRRRDASTQAIRASTGSIFERSGNKSCRSFAKKAPRNCGSIIVCDTCFSCPTVSSPREAPSCRVARDELVPAGADHCPDVGRGERSTVAHRVYLEHLQVACGLRSRPTKPARRSRHRRANGSRQVPPNQGREASASEVAATPGTSRDPSK